MGFGVRSITLQGITKSWTWLSNWHTKEKTEMVVKFSAFLSLLTISFPNTFPFSSVQLLSHAQLFATPWTTALQASLSITNSRSPPKPVFIVSVMPSNHIILCRPLSSCPQSFPASGSFQMSQLSASGGQSIGVSASTSVPPMYTQDWSPLGWTGWISLQSKGLSRVFSNTTVQKHIPFIPSQKSSDIILVCQASLSMEFSRQEHWSG